jgi:hypothetical protein
MWPPLVRSSKNAGQTINNRATERAELTGIATSLNTHSDQPSVILLFHLKGKKSVYSTIFFELYSSSSLGGPLS